jgi:hypothetical protein
MTPTESQFSRNWFLNVRKGRQLRRKMGLASYSYAAGAFLSTACFCVVHEMTLYFEALTAFVQHGQLGRCSLAAGEKEGE